MLNSMHFFCYENPKQTTASTNRIESFIRYKKNLYKEYKDVKNLCKNVLQNHILFKLAILLFPQIIYYVSDAIF